MSRLTLYQQVLGNRYDQLPVAVQRFHRQTGRTALQGWVETLAPASWIAMGLAYGLGAPYRSTRGLLLFELDAGNESETWTRHFPARTMTSRMRRVPGGVEERLGSARLTFNLIATENKLSMVLVKMKFFGLPCPQWLMPQVVAEETGDGDRLHFLVSAALPWVGMVASYRGYLDLEDREPA